jgi:hypothetical protein
MLARLRKAKGMLGKCLFFRLLSASYFVPGAENQGSPTQETACPMESNRQLKF